MFFFSVQHLKIMKMKHTIKSATQFADLKTTNSFVVISVLSSSCWHTAMSICCND